MLSILIVSTIKLVDNIILPVSKFRRELNKWMRYINNHPDEVIHISRNKKRVGVIMSPELYNDYQGKINVLS